MPKYKLHYTNEERVTCLDELERIAGRKVSGWSKLPWRDDAWIPSFESTDQLKPSTFTAEQREEIIDLIKEHTPRVWGADSN